MPFCSQCGTALAERDFFCGKCGVRQPISGTPGVYRSSGAALDGISPRTAAMLCYIPFVGWIAAILVLAAQKFQKSPEVRFHAFQGLYLFVAWLLLDWAVLPWFPFFPHHFFFRPLRAIAHVVLLGVGIFMLIKAAHEERYSLPIIGELAERSL